MFITGRACCFRCTFCSSIALFVLRSLTAVGYGRLYPVTTYGKGVAMVTSLMGTLYMAMPLSIVGNKFYDIYKRLEELKKRPMMQKLKKFALLVKSANKTGSLLKRLKSGIGKQSKEEEPENILDRYREDILNFINTRDLTSLETVNRDNIAKVQVTAFLGIHTRALTKVTLHIVLGSPREGYRVRCARLLRGCSQDRDSGSIFFLRIE